MTRIVDIWLNQNTVLMLMVVTLTSMSCMGTMDGISLVLLIIEEPPCKTALMNQRRRFQRIELR